MRSKLRRKLPCVHNLYLDQPMIALMPKEPELINKDSYDIYSPKYCVLDHCKEA